MFERRLYFHVDWLLLGAIMVIVGIGVHLYIEKPILTRLRDRLSARHSA